MKRRLGCFLLGCLLCQAIADTDVEFKKNQVQVAAAIEKILDAQVQMFLYSLDPHDARRFEAKLPKNSDKSFHGIPVLGKAEITSNEEKASLIKALADGARGNDGLVANCFDPRHGLRIVSKTATNDFVICFECLSVQTHGFKAGSGFLTSRSPQASFDKALGEHKLKRAD